MNLNILMDMQWLNDKSSVTKEELVNNQKSAIAAINNDYSAAIASVAAADACLDIDNAAVVLWIERYFERSGDNKQDYIDALKTKLKNGTTMSGIDWSIAPKWATKYGTLSSSGEWYYWINDLGYSCDKSPDCFRIFANGDELSGYHLKGDFKIIEERITPLFNIEINKEIKAALKTLKNLNYTYHGAELWKPPLSTTAASKQNKPLYTAKMQEAGELPSVGMECMVRLSIINDFFKCEISFKNKDVILIKYLSDGVEVYEHFGLLENTEFKPIDPPIKLIDKSLYYFDIGNNTKIVGEACFSEFGNAEWMINSLRTNTSYRAVNCTNITLLTAKVK